MALILGLALAGGGYDVSDRHIAGLAAWLIVVALLVLGAASRVRLGRPFYWTVGLIGGLSLLSAMSSLWSGSVELSVIEADRVLAYLGFFLAAFLIAQTEKRRQRFAEGLTIAIVVVGLLALGSRLLPNLLDVGATGEGARLRYPLSYWNADGAMFGIGAALLLWSSRRAASTVMRWLSVAAMPALLLALYFTYSRGGLLALTIAAGCTIALSRDRLWLLATLAIGSLATLPAVLAVQARRGIADNLAGQATVDQGVTVLLILLASTAVALVLHAGLRRLEARNGSGTGRMLELSRDPKLLKGIAAVVALVAIAAAIAVGGRAWDQFSSSDVAAPSQSEENFSDFSGAGRHDFFGVAIDAFGERPILGSGAGTYEFDWERNRSIDIPLHDAHSLYLESFAELGLLGGLLVLALVLMVLWIGVSTWRAALHPQRELYAVLLGAALAFAVCAGIDWFWEIAALAAVFLLVAGVLVAGRCEQLALRDRRDATAPDTGEGRFGLAVAGLAVAWIAAVALIGPLLVERELDASQSAAAEGKIASAVDHAETARSIEPFAASPYVQLALLAELQAEYPRAVELLTQAIDREDRNWQLYYLRSRVEDEVGNAAAVRADFERAHELNPRAPELQAGRP